MNDLRLTTETMKNDMENTQEQLSTLQTQMAKQENTSSQLSQRLDIFEEEIIKRVREI